MSNRFGIAATPPEPPPRVIYKTRHIKVGHGGAWKVAFADFVTAMMALFMVLWLASAADEAKIAVASYFDDPTGYSIRGHAGESRGGDAAPSRTQLEDLAEDIREAMRAMPELGQLEQHVEISVSPEGLRIELLEDEKGVFFKSGQPSPTGRGKDALLAIAAQLTKLKNNLAIEGHTDSKPFAGRDDYSNWELSTDRANAARRILLDGGVAPERITQIRGFADGRLRQAGAPEDPSNRRVSLIALYDK